MDDKTARTLLSACEQLENALVSALAGHPVRNADEIIAFAQKAIAAARPPERPMPADDCELDGFFACMRQERGGMCDGCPYHWMR